MPLLPHPTIASSTPTSWLTAPPEVALRQAQPGLRRQAIQEIASRAGTAILLGEQLAYEHDASVRHALLAALATHSDRISDVILADCLRSVDASLRNGAIDALRFNPGRRLRVAESLLDDPDADVRLGALTLLEETGSDDGVDWHARQTRLLALLDSEPDVNICAAVLGLIETIATESARAVIDRLRRRFAEEPYIQFASALVIMRLDALRLR